jgi:hypothetical protein
MVAPSLTSALVTLMLCAKAADALSALNATTAAANAILYICFPPLVWEGKANTGIRACLGASALASKLRLSVKFRRRFEMRQTVRVFWNEIIGQRAA